MNIDLRQGDCLELMKEIPDKSVDLVLCDLPYGVTACKWDCIIPLDKLWEQYHRIIKDNGAMVFTAKQPFTTTLISSNLKNFRYEWIWDKKRISNPMLAKKMPLSQHENICVFYKKAPIYNPQPYKKSTTGHAVAILNKQDKGNRKYILCTNNENNIAEDICYKRIKSVIKGNEKYADITGIDSNLKYFKTDFVDSKGTDKNKRKLVNESTDMLCIKESAFEKVLDKKDFKIFKNNKIHLGIIFDEEVISEFVKEAKKIDNNFHIYVFSLDASVPEEEFEEIKNKIKLCPIPEVILHVYRRVFKND